LTLKQDLNVLIKKKNCPYWAETGECKKNRTWMHKNCRRSCDRCHVVRVNNQRDINQYVTKKNKEAIKRRERKIKDQQTIRILEGSAEL